MRNEERIASSEIKGCESPKTELSSTCIAWIGLLAGKTKCGSATVHVLNISAEDRVRIRDILIKSGRLTTSSGLTHSFGSVPVKDAANCGNCRIAFVR